MVTSVQLGNFFQVNGRTVLGGGNTGFDTQSMIEDLVTARSIPIDNLEARVETNSKKITALDELRSLTENFQSALNFLRNPPGLSVDDQDVFRYRSASLSTSSGAAAENYVSVTASPGAPLASYTLEVGAVAQRTIQTTASMTGLASADDQVVFAATTANRLTAGALELSPGVTVTLVDGDSLNDVAARINAQTATTGVQASMIKDGTNSYRLQLQSKQTGLANAFDANVAANTAPGGVLESLSIDPLASQAAADASLTINGVTVTSASNTITDAVTDMSFTLKQPTGGVTVTAEVDADDSLVQDAVTNLVNAYNEIRVFNARQNERDEDGNLVEDAVLANNPTLRTMLAQIDAQLSYVVDGIDPLSNDPARLSDIGISFTDFAGDDETPAVRNVLQLDTNALADALADDFDAVRRVFAFDYTSSSSELFISSRTNAASVTEFSITIDTVGGTATASYLDDNAVLQTVALDYDNYGTGINLYGQEGTALEGVSFVYANTVDATIDVTMTQGIADRLYNVMDAINDETEGMLATERQGITNTNENLNDDIDRLEEQVETYREVLLMKFAALEQAIASVNTLLQALDAQVNAQNNQ